MCDPTLILLKEKIIHTDSVIKLLAEKNTKIGQLREKLKFLHRKYLEKSKEVEICKLEHGPLANDYKSLLERYGALESTHNNFVNSSEIKYQNVCRELGASFNKSKEETAECKKCAKELENNRILRKEISSLNRRVKKLLIENEKGRDSLETSDVEVLRRNHVFKLEDLKSEHTLQLKAIETRLGTEVAEYQNRVLSLEAHEVLLKEKIKELNLTLAGANKRLNEKVENRKEGNLLHQLLSECAVAEVPNLKSIDNSLRETLDKHVQTDVCIEETVHDGTESLQNLFGENIDDTSEIQSVLSSDEEPFFGFDNSLLNKEARYFECDGKQTESIDKSFLSLYDYDKPNHHCDIEVNFENAQEMSNKHPIKPNCKVNIIKQIILKPGNGVLVESGLSANEQLGHEFDKTKGCGFGASESAVKAEECLRVSNPEECEDLPPEDDADVWRFIREMKDCPRVLSPFSSYANDDIKPPTEETTSISNNPPNRTDINSRLRAKRLAQKRRRTLIGNIKTDLFKSVVKYVGRLVNRSMPGRANVRTRRMSDKFRTTRKLRMLRWKELRELWLSNTDSEQDTCRTQIKGIRKRRRRESLDLETEYLASRERYGKLCADFHHITDFYNSLSGGENGDIPDESCLSSQDSGFGRSDSEHKSKTNEVKMRQCAKERRTLIGQCAKRLMMKKRWDAACQGSSGKINSERTAKEKLQRHCEDVDKTNRSECDHKNIKELKEIEIRRPTKKRRIEKFQDPNETSTGKAADVSDRSNDRPVLTSEDLILHRSSDEKIQKDPSVEKFNTKHRNSRDLEVGGSSLETFPAPAIGRVEKGIILAEENYRDLSDDLFISDDEDGICEEIVDEIEVEASAETNGLEETKLTNGRSSKDQSSSNRGEEQRSTTAVESAIKNNKEVENRTEHVDKLSANERQMKEYGTFLSVQPGDKIEMEDSIKKNALEETKNTKSSSEDWNLETRIENINKLNASEGQTEECNLSSIELKGDEIVIEESSKKNMLEEMKSTNGNSFEDQSSADGKKDQHNNIVIESATKKGSKVESRIENSDELIADEEQEKECGSFSVEPRERSGRVKIGTEGSAKTSRLEEIKQTNGGSQCSKTLIESAMRNGEKVKSRIENADANGEQTKKLDYFLVESRGKMENLNSNILIFQHQTNEVLEDAKGNTTGDNIVLDPEDFRTDETVKKNCPLNNNSALPTANNKSIGVKNGINSESNRIIDNKEQRTMNKSLTDEILGILVSEDKLSDNNNVERTPSDTLPESFQDPRKKIVRKSHCPKRNIDATENKRQIGRKLGDDESTTACEKPQLNINNNNSCRSEDGSNNEAKMAGYENIDLAAKRLKRRSVKNEIRVEAGGPRKPEKAAFKRPSRRRVQVESPASPPHEANYDNLAATPTVIPLERVGELDEEIAKELLKKLIQFPDEPTILQEVFVQFSSQSKAYAIRLILEEVSLDDSTPDTLFTPPAPVMTVIQRTLLGLLVRLQETFPDLMADFLPAIEEWILKRSTLRSVQPLTRLYVAACKLRKDLYRMRRMMCDVLHSLGDLSVSFLFTALSVWTDILPLEIESKDNPLIKVLVQVVNMKTCFKPGYNLVPLKKLLEAYYGYPTEAWKSEDVFEELFQRFKENPTKYLEYCILILCKNHPNKWVCQQMTAHLKPSLVVSGKNSVHQSLVSLAKNLLSQLSGNNLAHIQEVKSWLEEL